jgi:hypothetical protein
VYRLHALEYTVVAISGFLLGCALRVDEGMIRRLLGLFLDI